MFTSLCRRSASLSCSRCASLWFYRSLLGLVNSKHSVILSTNDILFFKYRTFSSQRATDSQNFSIFDPVKMSYEKVYSHTQPLQGHISPQAFDVGRPLYSDAFDVLDDESLYPESFNDDGSLHRQSHECAPFLDKDALFDGSLNDESGSSSFQSDTLGGFISKGVTIGDEALKVRNSHISNILERALRDSVNPKCSVSLFGSAINGLWTDGSDLDVCVEVPNVSSRSAIIRNLRRISAVLAPLSPTRVFQNRFTAKIPILNWRRELRSRRPSRTPTIPSNTHDQFDLECENIPSIDISVNNVLAVVNSQLIGSYVSFEPRLRDLILFLKIWARNRSINDRSRGTLSSFAISLMAIHFFQHCSPPLLPSLQDLAFSTNEPPNYVAGVDCRFTTDIAKISAELSYLSKGRPNTLDERALLTNFFRYYGWYNLHSHNRPILIRSVDISEFDLSKFNASAEAFDLDRAIVSEPFLHVDNPFEVGLDVANISIHQRARVSGEFRRAYKLLKAGQPLSSLFNS